MYQPITGCECHLHLIIELHHEISAYKEAKDESAEHKKAFFHAQSQFLNPYTQLIYLEEVKLFENMRSHLVDGIIYDTRGKLTSFSVKEWK